MNWNPVSRRSLLIRGASAAAMGAAALVPAAFAGRPPTSAAGAGHLVIGGDLRVNRLGFGAMRITGAGALGEPFDAREVRAVLRRAVDLGIDFVDTADAYGPFVSERLIREALHPYPRGLVIATKGGLLHTQPGVWVPNGTPEHLRKACEGSLKRLGLEQIPLYQFHRPDPNVPFEDSIGTLAELQREGKIRHIGLSNVDVGQLARAQAIAEVVSVQNRYNVADRDSDPVLEACERQHLAFLPWAPLAQNAQSNAVPDPRLAALRKIAARRHIDLSQATLAWLLARSPVMLPIPGTSRVDHLEDNVAAAGIRFTRSDMQQVG